MSWAIDIGNSHTRVARWESDTAAPRLLELPEICRRPGGNEPLAAPRLIPTATEILYPPSWSARVGDWPLVRRLGFFGRRAIIGRPAVERNLGFRRASFAPTFKPYLDGRSLLSLARTPRRSYTARDVAELFLRELLAAIHRQTGVRVRDLVATTPVAAFETYRAELAFVARRLGVRRLRFVDEPVAASLGYGLAVDRRRVALVIDFGAGTLDLALVVLNPKGTVEGRAQVIAKEGRNLGGNLVDRWLLEALSESLGYPVDDRPADDEDEDEERLFWRRVMLAEARRIKETLFFQEWTVFHYLPPSHLRHEARAGASDSPCLEVRRQQLVEVLEKNRLYGQLEGTLDALFAAAAAAGIGEQEVDEVLMIGGSTLLPGVYPLCERRFGRDRVRAWQPFEAVALGACALAAGSFTHSDLIAHDYAFVTHDPDSHEKRYTVIVPRGTRVPTAPRLWTGRLVPTCALGEPERLFKLVVCEIGHDAVDGRRFVWDAQGTLHRVGEGGGDGEPIIVPLNDSDPTLGVLDPPQSPRDRRPRLEVAFGVNAERWLCATVDDLLTHTRLLDAERVVRLQ